MGTVYGATIGGTRDSDGKAAWFLGGDHRGALRNRSSLRGTADNGTSLKSLRAVYRVPIAGCRLDVTGSRLDIAAIRSPLDIAGSRLDIATVRSPLDIARSRLDASIRVAPFREQTNELIFICGLGTSSGLDTSSWLDVLGQRRDGGYQHRRQHDGQQQQLFHCVFLSGVWLLRLVGLYASIFVAFLLFPWAWPCA